MKMPISTAMFLFLLGASVNACAHDWQVVSDPSTLQFTASYQGDSFRGEFKHFDATIIYDSDELAKAKFDVSVKLGSVDTQSRERDQTLTGGDFFDTRKFPSAQFVTTDFERRDDGSVYANGMLDLHGVKQPVSLKVDFKPSGSGATLDVSTTLKRLDFGLGSSDDWADIGKDVAVHAHLVLH